MTEGLLLTPMKQKIDLINVKKKTLEKFGAVSKETAIEMVEGTIKNSLASLAISITGVAGPAKWNIS